MPPVCANPYSISSFMGLYKKIYLVFYIILKALVCANQCFLKEIPMTKYKHIPKLGNTNVIFESAMVARMSVAKQQRSALRM